MLPVVVHPVITGEWGKDLQIITFVKVKKCDTINELGARKPTGQKKTGYKTTSSVA